MLVADLLTKVLAKRELVCAIPEFCTCKERDPGEWICGTQRLALTLSL